jgi:hypothetical protein
MGHRRNPKSRVVGYTIWGPFSKDPVPVLERALANDVITQFDDGRLDAVWFNGPPGKALRALRDEIQAMVKKD